jgi:hypothetical protein
MKKIIIIINLTLLNTLFISAQESDSKNPRFEVSVNFIKLLNPDKLAEISIDFDYLLNASESVGLVTSFNPHQFSQSLNYKHFFSKKYAQGFYFALGTTFTKGRYIPINYNYNYYEDTSFQNQNLYIELGLKVVSKKNFFIDANIGLSRTIFGDNISKTAYYQSPYYIGLKIGKRF